MTTDVRIYMIATVAVYNATNVARDEECALRNLRMSHFSEITCTFRTSGNVRITPERLACPIFAGCDVFPGYPGRPEFLKCPVCEDFHVFRILAELPGTLKVFTCPVLFRYHDFLGCLGSSESLKSAIYPDLHVFRNSSRTPQ